MLGNGSFDDLLREQCLPSEETHQLSITQNTLINGLTRYPDLFSSKRGRHASCQLLPAKYFISLSYSVFNCLNYIYTTAVRGKGKTTPSYITAVMILLGAATVSAFLCVLIGKISFLGYKG